MCFLRQHRSALLISSSGQSGGSGSIAGDRARKNNYDRPNGHINTGYIEIEPWCFIDKFYWSIGDLKGFYMPKFSSMHFVQKIQINLNGLINCFQKYINIGFKYFWWGNSSSTVRCSGLYALVAPGAKPRLMYEANKSKVTPKVPTSHHWNFSVLVALVGKQCGLIVLFVGISLISTLLQNTHFVQHSSHYENCSTLAFYFLFVHT